MMNIDCVGLLAIAFLIHLAHGNIIVANLGGSRCQKENERVVADLGFIFISWHLSPFLMSFFHGLK